MGRYIVQVVETYRRYVEVEAANEDEAYDYIDKKVEDGDIDLPRDGVPCKYSRELFLEQKPKRRAAPYE